MYCKKCGTPTEYTLSKPKFCAGCGISLSSVTDPTPEQPPTPRDIPRAEQDEGEVDNVPDIQGLDMEIEGFHQHGVKFGEALGTDPGSERFTSPKDGLPEQTKEDFFKQFKKEAGSIKNNGNAATDKE